MPAALDIDCTLDSTTMDRLLDDTYEELLGTDGPIEHVIDRLVYTLEGLRAALPADVWSARARELVSHRLTHLLHQDPFTRRCYYKPRGYAGDARMLDYIYGEADDDDSTTLGRRVLDATVSAPAPQAVRDRKDLLAATIDRIAGCITRPRVLAVACGHLREARVSEALRSGAIGELVAFDQDERSLAVVERECRALPVKTLRGGVRDLIARRARSLGCFDLIYAAGLYDYLREEPARRLTQALVDRLNPGGTLLVANFLTGIRDRGYMESFMDWHLIFRTMEEIDALADDVPRGAYRHRTFRDPDQVIGFLEIVKEG